MLKMKSDVSTLQEEERRLAATLLRKLHERSGKEMRPEDKIAPDRLQKFPGAPKKEIPSTQMTSKDFLDMVEKFLAGLDSGNPSTESIISPGLGLTQKKSGEGFMENSKWTISKDPPKPSEQSVKGDERIAFYAHPPTEEAKDVPITVRKIKELDLVPPALQSSTAERKK